MNFEPGVIAAIVTSVSGLVVGLAALRKASSETRKNDADASGAIVDSASDVVKMLREQMAAQQEQIHEMSVRVQALEVTVGSWESWAEKVLQLLDRAVAMLEEEQRQRLMQEVADVKQTRPIRSRKHVPVHEPT